MAEFHGSQLRLIKYNYIILLYRSLPQDSLARWLKILLLVQTHGRQSQREIFYHDSQV